MSSKKAKRRKEFLEREKKLEEKRKSMDMLLHHGYMVGDMDLLARCFGLNSEDK